MTARTWCSALKEPKPEARKTFDNIAYRTHRWGEKCKTIGKQTINKLSNCVIRDKMECERVQCLTCAQTQGWHIAINDSLIVINDSLNMIHESYIAIDRLSS